MSQPSLRLYRHHRAVKPFVTSSLEHYWSLVTRTDGNQMTTPQRRLVRAEVSQTLRYKRTLQPQKLNFGTSWSRIGEWSHTSTNLYSALVGSEWLTSGSCHITSGDITPGTQSKRVRLGLTARVHFLKNGKTFRMYLEQLPAQSSSPQHCHYIHWAIQTATTGYWQTSERSPLNATTSIGVDIIP
jgi:hypothetical protein